MFNFGTPQPPPEQQAWRQQLDYFAETHQQELAALAWGLWQEHQDPDTIFGIDLRPRPHFVSFTKSALITLNEKVGNHLQEILGLIDGYKPEAEVLMLGIGRGQIKLIYFAPNPSPPLCFEEVNQEPESLLTLLEERLAELFPLECD
ncbi:hypothetical protein K4A83_07140 [Spirulina subsalsa FACHB-351]|uniref:Chaperone protein CcmS domain-containing protein n=1 Tax=Spirulina subsalsa FACHB-351 TaxID=234711 RepID=A0ABT3L3K9_9CYAN|nr:hypothetical protein [Spirulina subsalsa]MCW6036047.1 hypothetical protein [Spirulina subsalsa FACHB-351]